jgi:peptidoglycan/LPS O-acetylase OafA/YrhL
LRRLTRLEPPYIVNLGALCLFALVAHGGDRLGRVPHLLASLSYSHNFIYGAWSEINFVAWSLEVEAQFYISAPLLALLYRISSVSLRRGVIVTLMFACASLASLGAGAPYAVRMLLPFHLHFFLVGFLVADLYVTRHWREVKAPAAWTDLLATLGLLGVFWAWSHPSARQFAFAGVFVFYANVLRSRVWKRILNFRAVVVYGGMCYTIYLYHFWIMRPFVTRVTAPLCTTLPGGAGFLIAGLLTLIFVGLVATIPFLLFEKPFMIPTWPQWVAEHVFGRVRSAPPRSEAHFQPSRRKLP